MRRARGRGGWAAIASGLALLAPAAAWAFTLNSQTVELAGWRDRPLEIDYNLADCPTLQSGASVVDAITRGVALWNSVPASGIRLELGQAVATTVAQASARTDMSHPIVGCDPNLSASLSTNGTTVDSNGTPAATVDLRADASRAIITATVLLNAESGKAANIGNLSAMTLDLVVAHELGHVLGLGHSPDTAALMYYDVTSKTALVLAQDDYDGITYLYPRQEILNSGLLGCGTLAFDRRSPGNGPNKGGGGALPSGGVPAEALILFGTLMAAWAALRFRLSPFGARAAG